MKHEVDMKGLCNLARQYLRYYDGEYQRFEINGYWCKIKNKREAVEDLMHDGFFDNDGEISAGNVQGVLHAVRNVIYQMDEWE